MADEDDRQVEDRLDRWQQLRPAQVDDKVVKSATGIWLRLSEGKGQEQRPDAARVVSRMLLVDRPPGAVVLVLGVKPDPCQPPLLCQLGHLLGLGRGRDERRPVREVVGRQGKYEPLRDGIVTGSDRGKPALPGWEEGHGDATGKFPS